MNRLWLLPALAAAVFVATGCTPHIGDKCVLSTDCSVQGTLVCDTSQPGGYCTELNCNHQSCPANSLCVMFQSSVPGCAYSDYEAPSRTGRSFCMENCTQNSDCRTVDGYICANPRGQPWNASILDDNQSQGVCIEAAIVLDAGVDSGVDSGAVSGGNAAICRPYEEDASPSPDAGEGDAGADGEADASPDAGLEPPDAGADATVDSGTEPDAGADATIDAPADTGLADATGGG